MYYHQNKIIKYEESDLKSDLLSLLCQIPKQESEDQKLEILKMMSSTVCRLREQKDYSNITEELCTQLFLQINDGQSDVETELLKIIKQIVEFGAVIVKYEQRNKFFEIFSESSLLIKIEAIFYYQYQKEKNEKEYSKFTILILEIQLFIYKSEVHSFEFDWEISFSQFLSKYFNQLIEKIKSIMKIQVEDIHHNEILNQIENKIKDGIDILKAMKYYAEDFINSEFLAKRVKFHEIISPLIHFRCPQSLHCTQQFDISDTQLSENIFDLQEAAYDILNSLMKYYPFSGQFLIKNHSIFEHFFPVIINLAQQQDNNKSITQNQSISVVNDSIPPLLVIISLLKIHDQLFIGGYQLCQQAVQTPNFIQSLIRLTTFGRHKFGSMIFDEQSAQIREKSSNCLYCIWDMSDKEQKKMIIIEQRFAIIQIEGIGTCGGTLEQNNKAILSAIDNIYGIFRRWDSFFLTYDPIPYLLRQVEEQIEEEGAYEEIEANMFHLKVQEALGLNWSSSLKKSICNSKKDSSNGRDW